MPVVAKEENIVMDALKSAAYFPVWWYTTGAVYTAKRLARSVQVYARSVGLGVWVQNLFVPMYGFHDWQSRIISVFMRAAQIFFRGIAVLVWTMICLAQFMVYLALPIGAVAMIAYHLVYAAIA